MSRFTQNLLLPIPKKAPSATTYERTTPTALTSATSATNKRHVAGHLSHGRGELRRGLRRLPRTNSFALVARVSRARVARQCLRTAKAGGIHGSFHHEEELGGSNTHVAMVNWLANTNTSDTSRASRSTLQAKLSSLFIYLHLHLSNAETQSQSLKPRPFHGGK